MHKRGEDSQTSRTDSGAEGEQLRGVAKRACSVEGKLSLVPNFQGVGTTGCNRWGTTETESGDERGPGAGGAER